MAFELLKAKVAVLNWRDREHPLAGGAETFALAVVDELVARGASVTYVTSQHPGSKADEVRQGYKVHRTGKAFSVYPKVFLWLLRNRTKFDLVIDCSNGIGFFSPLAVGKKTKVVYVVHHVHTEQWSQNFSATVAAIGRLLEGPVARMVYNKATWVAVSESTAAGLHERLHVRNPIAIAHNGLASRISTPTPLPSKGHVVFVGRPVVHKRLQLLIEAVAADPRLSLDVIGDGPEMPQISAHAKSRNLQVKFLGRLSDMERDRLISEAAVLAIPSDHEGWGLVVLEAAVLGVPSVGFNVAGVHDAIRNGETGWVLPADGTEDELVARLTGALVEAVDLASKPNERIKLAKATQAWAAKFNWHNTTDAILKAAAFTLESEANLERK